MEDRKTPLAVWRDGTSGLIGAAATATVRHGRLIKAGTDTVEIPIKKAGYVVVPMGSTSLGNPLLYPAELRDRLRNFEMSGTTHLVSLT